MKIISLSHRVKRITYVLVFCGCCNKLLQVDGLKQIYWLTVLKARSQNQVSARAVLPLKAVEGSPGLCQLVDALCSRRRLHYYMASFLCVSALIFLLLKDTNWIRAQPDPVRPRFNLITSAKTLYPNLQGPRVKTCTYLLWKHSSTQYTLPSGLPKFMFGPHAKYIHPIPASPQQS